MSPNLDSPVQTQMAVAVFKSPLSGEYHRSKRMEGKQPAGRRRVFVQTETGCVLGMDLDRGDNAHTVKRRLQLAFNVPTEESSLTFGDMVLKNDLSAVRNDSPLLLTRNFLHRSSSTPCLSPTGKDIQQRDQSGPIEILGHSNQFARTKQLVKDIVKAIKIGVDPIPVHSGLGGAYYFRNSRGESVAIVKPTDEEPFAPNNPKGFVGKALGQPGLKRTVRVGETGFREVAAYLLDYDHFANVPPTALVKITHSIFNVNDGVNGNKPHQKEQVSKIASFQQFIPHDFDASDHGTSSFPVAAVHRIGILDIRILNTDRHAGNLLVRKLNDSAGRFAQVELIPIDHGLCLPESLEDPYFEWIHWPQASIPFSEDELEYIKNLDSIRDSEMLRMELPMIREACLRVLVLCTIFLKEAAAFGLCLAEIGEMMSREFRGGEEEPSELEFVCLEARRLIAEREMLSPKAEGGEEEFQFDIDCEEDRFYFTPKMGADAFMNRGPLHFGIGGVNCRFQLSKLEESIEEEEESEREGEQEDFAGIPTPAEVPTISKLSMSLKDTSLGEKSQKYLEAKPESSYLANTSSGHRSANEQLPTSMSFVKLADMNEEEWVLFLEKFQELLYPAFAKRKSVTLGQRQRQRLGTSAEMESGNLAENGHCSDAAGEPRSSLILLGTGCSSVVPNAMCLIQPSDPPCNVCFQSLSLPPERNPNYRCNTSLLIDYCQNNGEHKYILIDVGKTFREQVIRWFTFYKIPQVDSIILTHEHADAVLGLDDMRAVQPFSPTNDISPTPVYLSQYAMESIATKFPYLVKKKLKEGQELRRVAQLDWKIIESNHEKPFVASGLQFVPLPVMHGEDYLCLGFLFGEKCKVAYISDISRFPSSTEYVISKNGGGQLDLLILDTLYKKGSHNTHFCFPQTLEAVKRICPKRALLVGMTHEFDHHKDNETLMEWSRREGIPVQLAHDGLRVPIDL